MKLIGIAVRLSAAAAVSTTLGDASATAALCEASGECCGTAKALFETVTAGSGVPVDWREPTGAPLEVIAAEAGCADLVVVGRNDRVDLDSGMYQLDPADLVMACGTPVMVVSAQAPLAYHARRILLAWKSTPQAARAARDALPLLSAAQTGVITEVVQSAASGRHTMTAEALADFLATHGIDTTIRRLQDSGDAGYQLVVAASDNECDLIVAGAYGHSRVREWVLGGVTRSLLGASTVPCLLSH